MKENDVTCYKKHQNMYFIIKYFGIPLSNDDRTIEEG